MMSKAASNISHIGREEARRSGPQNIVAHVTEQLAQLYPKEYKLAAHYTEENGKGEVDDMRVNFFDEIIERSIIDVSGHLNMKDAEENDNISRGDPNAKVPFDPQKLFRVTLPGLVKDVKAYFKAKDYPLTDMVPFLLGNFKAYTKGFVQTPHPTEMLGDEAIAAEKTLLKILETDAKALFQQPQHGGDSFRVLGQLGRKKVEKKLRESLSALYNNIQPLTEPMEIPGEMKRSISFSETMFDAIAHASEDIFTHLQQQSRHLPDEQLAELFHLVAPQTWSPGDRDSKWKMTTKNLEIGYHQNRFSMCRHFAEKLIKLANDEFEEGETLHNPQARDAAEVIYQLLATAWDEKRQFKALEDQPYNETLDDYIAKKFKEHHIKKDDLNPDFKSLVERVRYERAVSNDQGYITYHDKADLINDLFMLRDQGLFQRTYDGSDRSNLTAIDSLIIQAGNFGLTALRTQIRQNRDVHDKVYERFNELLHDEGFTTEKNSNADDLLTQMKKPENEGGFSHEYIRTMIDHEIARIEQAHAKESVKAYEDLDVAMSQGKDVERDFYFYQTMTGLKFAASHSDFIPHYLIAECGCEEGASVESDMLKLLALLKAAEPTQQEIAQQHLGHLPPVELVPLVEHPEQVVKKDGKIPYVEEMKKLLSNPHFLEHQKEVTKAQYGHLLQHTTMKDGRLQAHTNLTVSDVLRSYDPEVTKAEKDDKRPVDIAMLMMGAGSDVTKFGGVAASAVMQHAMYELRSELAKSDNPTLAIDYIGCGGGLHRTQPVSSRFETVQGRSMRQTAPAIATKLLTMLTRDTFTRLIANPNLLEYLDKEGERIAGPIRGKEFSRDATKQERYTMAQLNLGNVGFLPRQPQIWHEISEPYANAAIERYVEMFSSERFQAFMSFTANSFAKLTSYAARSQNRVGAGGGDTGFPPEVDISSLRAIGYGASLNSSGSNASLYYGLRRLAENMLNEDHPQLYANIKAAYIGDPKMQDTINRATYGVVMADLDNAWRYLGEDAKPDAAEIERYKNFDEAELVTKKKDIKALLSNIDKAINAEKGADPLPDLLQRAQTLLTDYGVQVQENMVDEQNIAFCQQELQRQLNQTKLQLAQKTLAEITEEHDILADALLKLHKDISIITNGEDRTDEIAVGNEGKSVQRQIISYLPPILSYQLGTSYDNMKMPRTALSMLFQKFLKNNEEIVTTAEFEQHMDIVQEPTQDRTVAKQQSELSERLVDIIEKVEDTQPKRDGKKDYFTQIIYPAMGTLMECFEHTPRAYTSPYYALGQSAQQQINPTQRAV